MKTNYHPKSRARRDKPILFFLITIFIVGALFFSLFDKPLLTLISPVWTGRNAVSESISGIIDMLSTQKALVKENITLRERIRSLELENLSGRAAISREETLLLSLGRIASGDTVMATVLSRPPDTPYDVLIIDAGEREGVEIGQRVSLPEGGLLGHVEEVLPRSSRVRLPTSNGEKSNAILERGGMPVILEGIGGGSFKLILPRDTLVEVGDRIFSPYTEAGLVGIVESVELRPTDSFKEVLARSPANIQLVRYVIIR